LKMGEGRNPLWGVLSGKAVRAKSGTNGGGGGGGVGGGGISVGVIEPLSISPVVVDHRHTPGGGNVDLIRTIRPFHSQS